MTTLELLTKVRKLNIILWAEGDQLRYQAPSGVLTADLKAALIHRKEELIALFQRLDVDHASPQPVSRDQNLPLSFAQQRLWFLDQYEPDTSAYNICSSVRLKGHLNIDALQRTFDAIVDRHEVLRTTFGIKAGVPYQIITPGRSMALPVIDLSALKATAQETQAQNRILSEARRPFDGNSAILSRR